MTKSNLSPYTGTPVENLLTYLHSKCKLSDTFDSSIIPMLESTKHDKLYRSAKTDGVLLTAYWIDEGYSYMTEAGLDREGLPVTHVTDIFPPKMIMLHSDGFFNGKATKADMFVAKGAVSIPFTREAFDVLGLTETGVDKLATCILAENSDFMMAKLNMMKLRGDAKLRALVELYGIGVMQYFAQKQLADFFGMTEVHFSNVPKLF
ncbi:hypothetical protein [Pedobacter faecalis]|uniref:hypothetical protein n=1 Tax=Pedobacter faecalis TaxID=3041495 RepID=UPI00254A64D6|nr:hypothetical protein [Pedobacter sp. ELA7]